MTLRTSIILFLVIALAVGSVLAAAPKPGKETQSPLLNPAGLKGKAPATFKAKFETSKGDFIIEVTRDWSPNGADRFYNLVKHGFFNEIRFFRVVPNFVVQFGIHGNPAISKHWVNAKIPDDPVKVKNEPGYVTFAKPSAPNSRSTQVFINLKDNSPLDAMGFSPFGKVIEGFDVVQKLNGEYGENLTNLQGDIFQGGNEFLAKKAPNLDYIKRATIVKAEGTAPAAKPASEKKPAPHPKPTK